MDIMITSNVATIIQEVSPLFGTSATAGAAATAEAASVETAAGAATGAATVSVAAGDDAASSAKVGAVRPHNMAGRVGVAMSFFISISLKRFRAGFAGTNADHLFKFLHEDFTVADLAGLRSLFNRFENAIQLVCPHRRFQLDFRQEIHHIF